MRRTKDKKAGVAQLVEHQPSKLRVASSSLVSRSFLLKGLFISRFSSVVEHFLGKEEVTGSSPVAGSTYCAFGSFYCRFNILIN